MRSDSGLVQKYRDITKDNVKDISNALLTKFNNKVNSELKKGYELQRKVAKNEALRKKISKYNKENEKIKK